MGSRGRKGAVCAVWRCHGRTENPSTPSSAPRKTTRAATGLVQPVQSLRGWIRMSQSLKALRGRAGFSKPAGPSAGDDFFTAPRFHGSKVPRLTAPRLTARWGPTGRIRVLKPQLFGRQILNREIQNSEICRPWSVRSSIRRAFVSQMGCPTGEVFIKNGFSQVWS